VRQEAFTTRYSHLQVMMLSVNWSWVATADLVAERRDHARQLAGQRLSAVSYVLIDYSQPDRLDESNGPRHVVDTLELASPMWRSPTFDWADHAVEFTTETGRVFTCSWDSPGDHEGIWLREGSARGAAFLTDASVAVWDVSHAGRWDTFIGAVVTNVALDYAPWADEGYWCSRITIAFGDRLVELLLGEADGDGRLVPSADNIAVLFSPGLSPS
jgi:hypothetical protein